MNARFSFLLVLLACFCIAITSASLDANTTSVNITSVNITVTVTNTTTVTVTNTTSNATSSNATSPHATPINGSISASASPVDTCPEAYTCLGNSDTTCTNSWTQNSTFCASNNNGSSCCANGLICNGGTCDTNNIGATCKYASDCISGAGESLTCNDGTCAYLSFAGDSCDSDNICYSGLNCTEGICTGASAGQSCKGFAFLTNCSAGLYCNETFNPTLNPTCVALGTNGTSCSAYELCAVNFYCTNTTANGTCQPLFTVAEGGSCHQDNDCSDGNTCQSGKCTAPITDSTECTVDTDCSTGGKCTCSEFTGDLYCTQALPTTAAIATTYNPCQSDILDALNCQAEYNCTTQSANTDSCFYQNCYSELKASQSCGCDTADDFYGDCFYNDYCGGFPGWAIALIIIGSIAVVLAVVAVVFVAMRRKNTYDSI